MITFSKELYGKKKLVLIPKNNFQALTFQKFI